MNVSPRSAPFAWPVRVYYEDTDAGGVVYHASYLRFMERARTEWLRSHGWSVERLRAEFGLLIVVARAFFQRSVKPGFRSVRPDEQRKPILYTDR